MAKYTIDATGKRLGRVATEAAVLLMGKNRPSFEKRIHDTEIDVEITNVSKLFIFPKKKKQKVYTRYTGYPGGLRQEKLQDLAARKGYRELVRKAIYGMLPGNKLRAKRMKLLTIVE